MKINVFTYLTGYNTKIYERFIGTLFDTGFDGRLYLFVHENDYDAISQLKLNKEFFQKISLVTCPKNMYLEQNKDDLHDKPIHPQNYRFFLYANFLSKNPQAKDEYSLFCDARDVLFQKNPNKYPIDTNYEMFFFQEEVAIKDCMFNDYFTGLIKKSIPDGNFDYMDQKAICVGTVLVKNSSVIKFIVTLCETMIKAKEYQDDYIDQGSHNYLVYNHLYGNNFKIMTNLDNFVNTIGVDEAFKNIDNNNQITNSNNEISYIVHQYDRFNLQALKKLSSGKYDFT